MDYDVKKKSNDSKMQFIKESSEKLSLKNQEWKKRERELQARENEKKLFEEQLRGERPKFF